MAGLMSRTIADHQGEVLEAPQPGREPDRDARLLVRADARAAPERQARRRRRRHGEEAARAPDSRSSSRTSSSSRRRRGRRSRANREDLARQALERKAVAQQQLQEHGRAGAGARRTSRTSSSPAQQQLETRIESFRSQKEVLKAQYSAAEAQVRDRRGGDRDRQRHERHRAGDPAREGQDRGAAGARVGDRRADEHRRARGLHRRRPDAARPRARADLRDVAGRRRAREAEGRGRLGRRRAKEIAPATPRPRRSSSRHSSSGLGLGDILFGRKKLKEPAARAAVRAHDRGGHARHRVLAEAGRRRRGHLQAAVGGRVHRRRPGDRASCCRRVAASAGLEARPQDRLVRLRVGHRPRPRPRGPGGRRARASRPSSRRRASAASCSRRRSASTAASTRSYWIYGFKTGTFWPFVPTGEKQERDNARELELKAKLEPELPIEPDLRAGSRSSTPHLGPQLTRALAEAGQCGDGEPPPHAQTTVASSRARGLGPERSRERDLCGEVRDCARRFSSGG